MNAGQPVSSVETKKKELVGQYKNAGKEWYPEGQPEQVKVHDFIDPELGRANPYGVYDLGSNSAWVSSIPTRSPTGSASCLKMPPTSLAERLDRQNPLIWCHCMPR